MFCVYKITNLINNKVYIGKTNNFDRRMNDHIYCAINDDYTRKYPIHKSILKYGIENFKCSIVEEFELEKDALEREIYYIAFYKSNICRYGADFGYNLTDGGEGTSGHKHTEEHKKYLSKIHTGKILSEIHKINIGKSIKGLKRSVKSKENYKISKLGSKNPSAKLNEKQVKVIKKKFAESKDISKEEMTELVKEISDKYEVAPRTIRDIKNNKTWSHIKI